MKIKIIVFMALLLLAAPLSAQLRTGLKGGGNLSNINMYWGDVDLDNYNPRIVVQAGLMAEYMFMPRLGLQVELHYLNNGATINPEKHRQWFTYSDEISFEGFINMHTFRLPVYLKTKLALSSDWKIYVMGGGFVSFSTSASQHQKFSGPLSLKLRWSLYEPEVRILEDVGDNLFMQHCWAVGFAAEAGVEVMDRLTVGVGFAPVLNNMSALSYLPGTSIQPVTRMWTATVSAGYFF
ncbi:hypothetical protein SDC9_157263 [bioreactor metagenome]|uniref:Outer membrane protein beta-barrel domain-containing protein n=1 Tax=bioreactor metagenome TaxID=1076179 RepID=A0A645F7U9_9ZZZZ